MFKNMKIEINDQQPLDEVVRELERLGYICDWQSSDEPNFMVCYKDGTFSWFVFDVESEVVSLQQLKEM